MDSLDIIIKYLPRLIDGAQLTVVLLLTSVLAGLVLALPIGIARSARSPLVSTLPFIYIFLFRGTPLLLQLFMFYYGLAQFEWVRNSVFWPFLRDPFWCALITMTMHTAAYIAEIIRGAIQSVPVGEKEASQSLGMSRTQSMLFIIIPRAIRIGLPAYSNEVILMLKASALASTITLMELTGATRTVIARTYMAADFFFIAGLIYLLITLVLVALFRLLEKSLHVDDMSRR